MFQTFRRDASRRDTELDRERRRGARHDRSPKPTPSRLGGIAADTRFGRSLKYDRRGKSGRSLHKNAKKSHVPWKGLLAHEGRRDFRSAAGASGQRPRHEPRLFRGYLLDHLVDQPRYGFE